MRATALCVMFAAAAAAGCLRNTAFKCIQDSECGAIGICEPVGYCSVPDPDCVGTGRSFSDSAGGGLSRTCVPLEDSDPRPDGGLDASTDGSTSVGCPSGYASVNGSSHRYKALNDVSWGEAEIACARTSVAAYLAIPEDATELANLAMVTDAPFWIGIDDQRDEGMYKTQKNAAATFLPWATGEPDDGMGGQDCVTTVSATRIATDRCGTRRPAICECEP